MTRLPHPGTAPHKTDIGTADTDALRDFVIEAGSTESEIVEQLPTQFRDDYDQLVSLTGRLGAVATSVSDELVDLIAEIPREYLRDFQLLTHSVESILRYDEYVDIFKRMCRWSPRHIYEHQEEEWRELIAAADPIAALRFKLYEDRYQDTDARAVFDDISELFDRPRDCWKRVVKRVKCTDLEQIEHKDLLCFEDGTRTKLLTPNTVGRPEIHGMVVRGPDGAITHYDQSLEEYLASREIQYIECAERTTLTPGIDTVLPLPYSDPNCLIPGDTITLASANQLYNEGVSIFTYDRKWAEVLSQYNPEEDQIVLLSQVPHEINTARHTVVNKLQYVAADRIASVEFGQPFRTEKIPREDMTPIEIITHTDTLMSYERAWKQRMRDGRAGVLSTGGKGPYKEELDKVAHVFERTVAERVTEWSWPLYRLKPHITPKDFSELQDLLDEGASSLAHIHQLVTTLSSYTSVLSDYVELAEGAVFKEDLSVSELVRREFPQPSSGTQSSELENLYEQIHELTVAALTNAPSGNEGPLREGRAAMNCLQNLYDRLQHLADIDEAASALALDFEADLKGKLNKALLAIGPRSIDPNNTDSHTLDILKELASEVSWSPSSQGADGRPIRGSTFHYSLEQLLPRFMKIPGAEMVLLEAGQDPVAAIMWYPPDKVPDELGKLVTSTADGYIQLIIIRQDLQAEGLSDFMTHAVMLHMQREQREDRIVASIPSDHLGSLHAAMRANFSMDRSLQASSEFVDGTSAPKHIVHGASSPESNRLRRTLGGDGTTKSVGDRLRLIRRKNRGN